MAIALQKKETFFKYKLINIVNVQFYASSS